VSDRSRLIIAAFLRAVATGMVGILLGVYLPRAGCSPAETGFIVAAGLAGCAVAMLLATLRGDAFGRKRALIALGVLGAAGIAVVAATTAPGLLAAAAFLGMVNGMGRDRGASLVIEQAILPATTEDRGRTRAFAWYNVAQDSGHALGSLCAALPAILRRFAGIDGFSAALRARRLAAGIVLATAVVYLDVTPAVEASRDRGHRPSRRRRSACSGASARSSLWTAWAAASSTATLLSLFFFQRFGVNGLSWVRCSSAPGS
jgi:MFS family permease